jgi:alkanesulfonate monooxygenase SsuD/methylene tetrahydromethanopterin reductase-like flavin-dependent oxidoreductase (luciferase family)
MRIGVNLGPCGDWQAIVRGVQLAEACGYDAVGFLDHYHADKMEWPYLSGWSLYGALAVLTQRIKLVPLVVDHLNYLPGVLAKESASLSIVSGGRFELGIGAGDFFEEARAWNTVVPSAQERVERLCETITVLRQIWQGEQVNFEGSYTKLAGAAALPVPVQPLRVMVGAGSSRRLIRSAATYADEINVYANDDLIHYASEQIKLAQRPVALSVYAWDWPEGVEQKLVQWDEMGVERVFLTFWPPYDTIQTWSNHLPQ